MRPVPRCAASAPALSLRGEWTRRRRLAASAPSLSLAAIMKSSIRFGGAILSAGPSRPDLAIVHHRLRSPRDRRSARPACRVLARRACAASSCSLSCACKSGDAATLGGRRGRAFQPRAHARCKSSCARLRMQGAIDACRWRARHRPPPPFRSPRRRGRRFSLSDVRSVESSLGQHREIADAGVDGGGLMRGVAGRWAFPWTRRNRHRRSPTSTRMPPGTRSAHSIWSRSRESSLSIDDHSSAVRSRSSGSGSAVDAGKLLFDFGPENRARSLARSFPDEPRRRG